MTTNWRTQTRRAATVLAVVTTLGLTGSACVVTARVLPVHVVDEAPPEPRYESDVVVRPGHVWVGGRWQWQEGRWAWKAGHYVPARSGYQWEAGRWERRGNRHHWVEGRWVVVGHGHAHTAPRVRDHRTPAPPVVVRDHRTPAPPVVVRDHRTPAFPTAPPPPPRHADGKHKHGHVWIQGHWVWGQGKYEWQEGHFQAEAKGKTWQAGHWEHRGDRYVWTEGKWIDAPVNVRDHRKEAPAPDGRPNERVKAKRAR